MVRPYSIQLYSCTVLMQAEFFLLTRTHVQYAFVSNPDVLVAQLTVMKSHMQQSHTCSMQNTTNLKVAGEKLELTYRYFVEMVFSLCSSKHVACVKRSCTI